MSSRSWSDEPASSGSFIISASIVCLWYRVSSGMTNRYPGTVISTPSSRMETCFSSGIFLLLSQLLEQLQKGYAAGRRGIRHPVQSTQDEVLLLGSVSKLAGNHVRQLDSPHLPLVLALVHQFTDSNCALQL